MVTFSIDLSRNFTSSVKLRKSSLHKSTDF